jgi:dextranase
MIKDIYCNKCQYYPKDTVELIIEKDLEAKNTEVIIIKHLNQVVKEIICNTIGNTKVTLGEFPLGGYQVSIGDFYTAFDVLEKTSDSPRYGFISDFKDKNYHDGILQMNKYHLNLIQYYDWMYRHHELVPRDDFFVDPMNRTVEKAIITGKIDETHKFGMKAIAYGAIYGAEKEYYEEHSDEIMKDNLGRDIIFIDIIGMMDISQNTKWRKHIIKEFRRTITEMNFDGIHLDQYGFPKYAKSTVNPLIDLSKEIPTFINETIDEVKDIDKEVTIDFNYVNNWPIDTIKDSNQPYSYIEVWDPHDSYNELAIIINDAKNLSDNRPVVIAAYIHAYQNNIPMIQKEMSALLTMACVYSMGAYPLLFGEEMGILSDPYYVNYSKYTESFESKVRDYQDFIVKYKELIFASKRDISRTFINGINEEVQVFDYKTSSNFEANSIGCKVFEADEFKLLNLVNLLNQENDKWNIGKTKTNELTNIRCNWLIMEEIEGIYFGSPDYNHGELKELDYKLVEHDQGKAIEFIIDKLNVWSMIYIKIKTSK